MRVRSRAILGSILQWSGLSVGVAGATAAQSTIPVFHYSTLTSTFDGLLPIGQRFQIRGAVPASVDAIRVESFGFQKLPPAALRESRADVVSFCAALKRARADAQRDVLYSTVGWDRTEPGSVEFAVTHPRLYYGRNYTFVFTNYGKVDKALVRTLLERELRAAIVSSANFERLLREGLSGEQVQRDLENAIISALQGSERSCEPLVIGRDASDVQRFWRLAREALPVAIAELATRSREQEALHKTPGAHERLKATIETLPDTLRASPDAKAAVAAADRADWIGTRNAVDRLSAAIRALQDAGKLTAREATQAREALWPVVQAVGELARAQETLNQKLAAAPEVVAQRIAESYKPPDLQGLFSATTVLPYLETMKEALPFLISLDGGISYALRFREFMPIAGANIKLNRVDFDDPLDHSHEVSVLIGLGLSSPDDLDPDYEGIFSGSKRSLWLGLGVRPGFAPLLRGHVGLLLFRQRDENPLQNDLHTRASLTLGVSANWDALDFAATLIKGRPTLGAGGL